MTSNHSDTGYQRARGEVPALREVVVKEFTSLFDGERLAVVRELEIARIAIATAAKPIDD